MRYLALMGCICSFAAPANELIFFGGMSDQPGESQTNTAYGIEATHLLWQRSQRQQILIGTSYTHLSTDADLGNDQLHAVSVFPELRLFTEIAQQQYFFQVRALGPTWLSQRYLGEREQAMHFALQAQIGFGTYWGKNEQGYVSLFYRHFSNADIKQPNDGMDVMFNLGIGYRF